jgi:hypothetical protein
MTADRAAQQQTLSVRINEALRQRLERAKELVTARTGESVTMSEVAKQFLEAARDDRLEVVELLADPTGSLVQVRRKGDEGLVLSRAEWTTLAHFIRFGIEKSYSPRSPNTVSKESLIALLDAFLAVYDLRPAANARLDGYYLANLPPDFRPPSVKRDDVSPDTVRYTVAQSRRHLTDPSATWVPLMVGRNFFVLLDEDEVPGTEDLTRALRPYWRTLWRLGARGHFVLTREPVRPRTSPHDGVYRPPIPSISEGPYELSFARGQGQEFSVLLGLPGPRGPMYPIVGYPRIAEFRKMLADLVADSEPGDWTGAYFYVLVSSPTTTTSTEIWFRSHDNGIAFGFTVPEWKTLHTLFERAWELPEIRVASSELELEYGEL